MRRLDAACGLTLLEAVFGHIARRSVIFIRQEFSRHRNLHTIAFRIWQTFHHHVEVDRRHNTVAELFFDQRLPRWTVHHYQLVKAVDQGVGWRHRSSGTAHWHLVDKCGFGFTKTEQLLHLCGLWFREL